METLTREQAIEKAVLLEMERVDDQVLGSILEEGCKGFTNFDNEELEEVLNDVYGEDITIKSEEKTNCSCDN